MADQTSAITEADHQSFEAKWQSFVDGLTPAEQALLEQRLAGEEDDVQGYTLPWLPLTGPSSAARPRPRPGSSAGQTR